MVATQVTVVVPYGKKLLDGGVQLTSVPLETCGGGYATVVPLVVHHGYACARMFVGQVMTGSVPE